MKTPEAERYVFHRLAAYDIGQKALEYLKRAENAEDGLVREALFQMAVIAYCRPFSECRFKGRPSFTLGGRFVPKEYRKLHRDVKAWRDKLYAHTDMDIRELRLERMPGELFTIFPVYRKEFPVDEIMKRSKDIGDLFHAVY